MPDAPCLPLLETWETTNSTSDPGKVDLWEPRGGTPCLPLMETWETTNSDDRSTVAEGSRRRNKPQDLFHHPSTLVRLKKKLSVCRTSQHDQLFRLRSPLVL